jgi:hypothetical protein
MFTYTKATGWIEHAATRDEIMVHLLAAAPYFDLRVFQDPTDIELVTMDTQRSFD